MDAAGEDGAARSDWRHWRRVVEIPTRLPAEDIHARLTRLFAEGPRISGVKGGATESSDRFRIDFYGGRIQPDIVIHGRIGSGRVQLTFDAATALGMGAVVLLAFCAVELALGNLTPAQAAFSVVALGALFVVMGHVLGPAIVTHRVTAWIKEALER
jgi:hypothetical protein